MTCQEMLATLAGRTAIGDGRPGALSSRQDSHRDQFRRPRGQSVRAWRGRRRGFRQIFFIHPLRVAIDSETEAVLGLLDTPNLDPVQTPSNKRRGGSGRLRTRRACAGCEGSNQPARPVAGCGRLWWLSATTRATSASCFAVGRLASI